MKFNRGMPPKNGKNYLIVTQLTDMSEKKLCIGGWSDESQMWVEDPCHVQFYADWGHGGADYDIDDPIIGWAEIEIEFEKES